MSAQTKAFERWVSTPKRRGQLWIGVIVLLVIVSFVCLAYPIYVIRPFRAQGARELSAALVILRYRVALTSICAAAATVALFLYWRLSSRRWKRAAFSAAWLAVCACAALCHVNIYELMFHANTHPAFSPAANTKLNADEKVIAVRIGSGARAYPIRSISYHHIINDVVAGVPIGATY
jgi:uncharacterized BrkB/YihY/UPF0761 family membrane protein